MYYEQQYTAHSMPQSRTSIAEKPFDMPSGSAHPLHFPQVLSSRSQFMEDGQQYDYQTRTCDSKAVRESSNVLETRQTEKSVMDGKLKEKPMDEPVAHDLSTPLRSPLNRYRMPAKLAPYSPTSNGPEIPLEDVDFVAKYGMHGHRSQSYSNQSPASSYPSISSQYSPMYNGHNVTQEFNSNAAYSPSSSAMKLQNQHLSTQLYKLQREAQSLQNEVIPRLQQHGEALRQDANGWKIKYMENQKDNQLKEIEIEEVKTEHRRLQVENKEMKERITDLQQINKDQLSTLESSNLVMYEKMQQLRQEMEGSFDQQLMDIEQAFQRKTKQHTKSEKLRERRMKDLAESLQKLLKIHEHQHRQNNIVFENITNNKLAIALQELKDTAAQNDLSLRLMQQSYGSLLRDAEGEQLIFNKNMKQLREQFYSEISHRDSEILLINGELESERRETQRLHNQIESVQNQLKHKRDLLEANTMTNDTNGSVSGAEDTRLLQRMESLQQQNKQLTELQEEFQDQASRERQMRRDLEVQIHQMKDTLAESEKIKRKDAFCEERIQILERQLTNALEEHERVLKEKEAQLTEFENQKKSAMALEAATEEKKMQVQELEEELERVAQEADGKLSEIEQTRHMVQQLRQQMMNVEQARKQDKYEISQRDKEIQRLNRDVAAEKDELGRVHEVLQQRMTELEDVRRQLVQLENKSLMSSPLTISTNR